MMTDLLAALHFGFLQRALIAGGSISVMCGLLGVFVVQRRLSFLGDGLAHAAFGGMGLGVFLMVTGKLPGSGAGLLRQPLWVALPFVVIIALGIAWVRNRTRLSSDTAIGVFFAVSVALGVMLFSKIPPDAAIGFDVMDLLFGSILAVSPGDLVTIALVTALFLLTIIFLWSRLAYATFDEELARTDGVRTRMLEYLLFAAAAVVIVVSSLVVGIILMAAYLVIPAATARLASPTLFHMSILSMIIGVVSTAAGMFTSFLLDVPSGSTIILVQAALFLMVALVRRR